MQSSFSIGPVTVTGDVILSPMDGLSDLPFRSICRELGSAISYTEFINALDILFGNPYVHQKYTFLDQERPMAFQIFDSEPQRLLEAALRLQEYGPDTIDVNMGCSSSTVTGRGAGVSLMRFPKKVAQIFSLLSRSLNVPVTGKIRLGWDEASRNHVEIAQIIEDNGGALVAVHGRTKAQAYGGSADWDAIAEVKAAVKIPVVGNGDLRSPADIDRILAHTGCEAVMIGRAAVGNPWIFSRLARDQVPAEAVRPVVERHLQRSLEFYGPERGLVLFRKHAHRYLSPYPLPREIRQKLLTLTRLDEFLLMVDQILENQAAIVK